MAWFTVQRRPKTQGNGRRKSKPLQPQRQASIQALQSSPTVVSSAGLAAVAVVKDSGMLTGSIFRLDFSPRTSQTLSGQ